MPLVNGQGGGDCSANPLWEVNKNMDFINIGDKKPQIEQSVFIAPTATIIGDVIIGMDSSVWFNCVIRGDVNSISIGEATSIQDLSTLHSDAGKPLTIGNRVTVGHACVLHGCIIEDGCLIGMGAIVMNGAHIGRGSVIAAGSVVTEGKIIPPFSLVTGAPGKVIRTYNESKLDENRSAAQHYVDLARAYRERQTGHS
jgi:carbonic anhydrase/acetyltransferase-like protein (isoleucine patch superfamily)